MLDSHVASTFIDLFAGLGGFHVALRRLGLKCVFASEIDPTLQQVYAANFGMNPCGDITHVIPADVPSHDILCAGFPCQPFSKAGEQLGFDCPRWGNLLGTVLRIVEHHLPSFLLLENVPNLLNHNKGETWVTLLKWLSEAGYFVYMKKLSPHNFGIPQVRERVFIVCSRAELTFNWPTSISGSPRTLRQVLGLLLEPLRYIPSHYELCINTWQRFLDCLPVSARLPSFPIWSMEFDANYPYTDVTPWTLGTDQLGGYRGAFGQALATLPLSERMTALPKYAREEAEVFPKWKVKYIEQNRDFFDLHRSALQDWIPEIVDFAPSLQKFEWNCQGSPRDLWSLLIQIRASGVRVKRPTSTPSLIAMTSTQVPIIGWEKRFMSPWECAELQGLKDLDYLPASLTRAYTALGNAVNADVVEAVADRALTVTDLPRLRRQLPRTKDINYAVAS